MSGEVVGILYVEHFRECPSMRNAEFLERIEFAPGRHEFVLATDYAALSEKLSDCEIALGGETAQREHYTSYTVIHDGVLLYCSSGMRDAYAAMQAKLDAVTKDARWLLDLIDDNEGRTAYSLRAQHTMTDIESRLTDQGHAGEGA